MILAGMEDSDVLVQMDRNVELIHLLDEWMASDANRHDDDLDEQMHEFEKDRPSTRRLF
jgi:hypothetical protein